MANDAKTQLDRTTHRLQDQPTTAEPVGTKESNKSQETADRQPTQAQQHDTTGTTLPASDGASNEDEHNTGGA